MDEPAWTEIVTAGVAIVAAFVAAFSPFVTWKLGRKGQREDARRNVRLGVFGALMENRHTTESREAIRALNLVDVAFHDSPEVRRFWREYFDMIDNRAFFQDELGAKLRDQKLHELLTEMARHLDFGIDRFDVARTYAPRWLIDEENLRFLERQERLDAARRARVGLGAQPSPVGTATSPPPLRPGMYLVRYTGSSGSSGVGTIAIGNGTISGSDITGGRYEGRYVVNGDRLQGTVLLHVDAGATLVTGTVAEQATDVSISLDLPLNFADGQGHRIEVAGHPVTITFQRVQDL